MDFDRVGKVVSEKEEEEKTLCASELHNTIPGKTQQAILLSKISLQKAMWLMWLVRALSGPWAQLSSVAEHRLEKAPIPSASS